MSQADTDVSVELKAMFGSKEGEGGEWERRWMRGGDGSEWIILIPHVVWYDRKERENRGFKCN